MKLDSTRFRAWRDCPENFKLRYLLNFAGKAEKEALSKGSALHEYMDASVKGEDWNLTTERLVAGGISAKYAEIGRILASELVEKYPASAALISEREFEYRIPGSPHSMIGKIDRIVLVPGYTDKFRVLDWKSKGNNRGRQFMEIGKRRNEDLIQAQFYAIGAKTWGYPISEFHFITACQSTPIAVWETEVPDDEITDYKLELVARDVHIACETIQSWITAYGIEEPWPHNRLTMPCKVIETQGSEVIYCEMQHICQQTHKIGCIPEGFQLREEHLDLLKEKA